MARNAEIKNVKLWLKLNAINKLWIRLCSISDRISRSQAIELSEEMRLYLKTASDKSLDNTMRIMLDKIKKIEDKRMPKELFPIKQEHNLF